MFIESREICPGLRINVGVYLLCIPRILCNSATMAMSRGFGKNEALHTSNNLWERKKMQLDHYSARCCERIGSTSKDRPLERDLEGSELHS